MGRETSPVDENMQGSGGSVQVGTDNGQSLPVGQAKQDEKKPARMANDEAAVFNSRTGYIHPGCTVGDTVYRGTGGLPINMRWSCLHCETNKETNIRLIQFAHRIWMTVPGGATEHWVKFYWPCCMGAAVGFC